MNTTTGISVDQLRANTRHYAPCLEIQTVNVWQEWLNLVEDFTTHC